MDLTETKRIPSFLFFLPVPAQRRAACDAAISIGSVVRRHQFVFVAVDSAPVFHPRPPVTLPEEEGRPDPVAACSRPP
ncbi:hypothetical protein BDA96_01G506500 [Sorghum bicolor]|uniref:Uncharacterized protein n=1 Tax=Sorghum bicolor TaxID=4558 RepID=A0A921V2E6_SORBI|nr:hypothetical protein BDA96_01G506500 [Sorghum bicolor]